MWIGNQYREVFYIYVSTKVTFVSGRGYAWCARWFLFALRIFCIFGMRGFSHRLYHLHRVVFPIIGWIVFIILDWSLFRIQIQSYEFELDMSSWYVRTSGSIPTCHCFVIVGLGWIKRDRFFQQIIVKLRFYRVTRTYKEFWLSKIFHVSIWKASCYVTMYIYDFAMFRWGLVLMASDCCRLCYVWYSVLTRLSLHIFIKFCVHSHLWMFYSLISVIITWN